MFGSANNEIAPFSFTSPTTAWTPPANFSPERAFPPPQPSPAPEAEMADLSMSTAGTETPDASPTLARQAAAARKDGSGASSMELTLRAAGSPLRRSTFKARDRDRSRERERVLERKRGMPRPRWNDGDTDEDEDEVRVSSSACLRVLSELTVNNAIVIRAEFAGPGYCRRPIPLSHARTEAHTWRSPICSFWVSTLITL